MSVPSESTACFASLALSWVYGIDSCLRVSLVERMLGFVLSDALCNQCTKQLRPFRVIREMRPACAHMSYRSCLANADG